MYLPLDSVRAVEPAYARPGDRVGFADAYPVLVASLASLADLNARLVEAGAAAVPMDRFRPNVVIDGDEPFAEEERTTIDIGALRLRTPKRCSRCKVVTIDQATGVATKEPLKMLASYRTRANNVYVAMNAIPDTGPEDAVTIRLGDPVR